MKAVKTGEAPPIVAKGVVNHQPFFPPVLRMEERFCGTFFFTFFLLLIE
jgi:hypothetical protein